MILSVTLNPLLEKKYTCKNFVISHTHRTSEFEYAVGGKGINVSRELNHLKIHNQSMTFLGGDNGRTIRKKLNEEGINYIAVSTKSQNREGTVIFDPERLTQTSIMQSNYHILDSEISEFKIRLEKAIQNCTVLLFSGSLPSESAYEIMEYGIKLAQDNDKLVFIDSYGAHLDNIIRLKPNIMHNNIQEIESSLNIKLSSENEIIKFLNNLYESGVKIAVLTDGDKPSYAMNFGFIYKISFPTVPTLDSTGCGDSLVAGMLYGIDKALTFKESIGFATKLGLINAQRWDVCNISLKEVDAYSIDNIKIEAVGEKMDTVFG